MYTKEKIEFRVPNVLEFTRSHVVNIFLIFCYNHIFGNQQSQQDSQKMFSQSKIMKNCFVLKIFSFSWTLK